MGAPTTKHGGKRSGAGRRAGAANRVTQSKFAKTQTSGPTPLDVLLYAMRVYFAKYNRLMEEAREQGKNGLTNDAADALMLACKHAKRAAPYCTPRLTKIPYREFNDMRREAARQKANEDNDAEDLPDYDKMSAAELIALTRRTIAES